MFCPLLTLTSYLKLIMMNKPPKDPDDPNLTNCLRDKCALWQWLDPSHENGECGLVS